MGVKSAVVAAVGMGAESRLERLRERQQDVFHELEEARRSFAGGTSRSAATEAKREIEVLLSEQRRLVEEEAKLVVEISEGERARKAEQAREEEKNYQDIPTMNITTAERAIGECEKRIGELVAREGQLLGVLNERSSSRDHSEKERAGLKAELDACRESRRVQQIRRERCSVRLAAARHEEAVKLAAATPDTRPTVDDLHERQRAIEGETTRLLEERWKAAAKLAECEDALSHFAPADVEASMIGRLADRRRERDSAQQVVDLLDKRIAALRNQSADLANELASRQRQAAQKAVEPLLSTLANQLAQVETTVARLAVLGPLSLPLRLLAAAVTGALRNLPIPTNEEERN